MSKLKVSGEELGLSIGDLLKWEATPLTRILIDAPSGTQIGEWVDYPTRQTKLIALSHEKNGSVLVQPYHCIIDLQHDPTEQLSPAQIAQANQYCICYLYKGKPVTGSASPLQSSSYILPEDWLENLKRKMGISS